MRCHSVGCDDTPDNAIGYAMHSSRSHNAVIRVYDAAGSVIETKNGTAFSSTGSKKFAEQRKKNDDAGNVIETHEHKGDFKNW
jgi:hypothetical protein